MISIGFFHFLSAVVFTGLTGWIIWLLKEMSAAKKLAQCFIQEKRLLSFDVARGLQVAAELAGMTAVVVESPHKEKPLPIFPAALGRFRGLPAVRIVLSEQKAVCYGPFLDHSHEAEIAKDALRLFFCDKIQIDYRGEKTC